MDINRNRIVEEIRVLFVLIVVAFTIKSTLVEIYVVPTGSMEDTILTGDMLIGNKFIYGMRTPTWIGVPWTRIGLQLPWYRLPAFKEVENGDVTIFEFPRDPFQKYVKRCIGVPGDSIYINSGKIMINGEEMDFPKEAKYVKGYQFGADRVENKLYPYFNGNRDNLSGFIVPYKGMVVEFDMVDDWQTVLSLMVQDGNTVKLANKTFTMIDPYEIARTHGLIKYKLLKFITSSREASIREQKDRSRYISKLNQRYKTQNLVNPWYISYGKRSSDYIKNNVTVNGETLEDIGSYIIKNDYYFFMGDNRDSSYDSRYWGFVPNTQILGTPLFALINLFKFKLRMKVIS